MERKVLIICIDGFGAEYFEKAPTPALDYMASSGDIVLGSSVIPSVTNVNNVSIITGRFPKYHGITSNYWIDKKSGKEVYMESPEFLCCKTILEMAKKKGLSTALLTSKKKLLTLLNAGADYWLAAEEPDKEMVSRLGPSPDIYDPAINHWLFKALKVVLSEKKPDVVYCSTTDGAMHKYAPEDERSIEHVSGLDRILGEILEENPDMRIFVTADHGMSAKLRGIDLQKAMSKRGFKVKCLPIIKDRYVAHHQNLGGAAYVFLDNHSTGSEAAEALKDIVGVEAAYLRVEAAELFGLMADRIGDIMVLGEKDVVFGEFDSEEVPVSVRSHGSVHESRVPIIGYPKLPKNCRMNFDVTRSIEF